MTDHDPNHLSEEEAARLWQRAAQLQAEAARLAEAEAHDETEASSTDVVPREGYQLAHVRAAAVEAGIGEEYLDAALTDLRAERALPPPARRNRIARRFLHDPPDSLTVRRVISATPQKVLETMEEVFTQDPYRLTLTDRQGDPLNGGLLVFSIEGAGFVVATGSSGFQSQVSHADLRQVFASIRPIDGEKPACEVTFRSPVAWAYGINAAVGGVMVAVGSGIGLAASWAIGSAAALALLGSGVGAGAVAAAIAAGGTLGAGTLSTWGFRSLYDWSLNQGVRAIDGMLAHVAVRAEGGWSLTGGSDSESGGPKSLSEPQDFGPDPT